MTREDLQLKLAELSQRLSTDLEPLRVLASVDEQWAPSRKAVVAVVCEIQRLDHKLASFRASVISISEALKCDADQALPAILELVQTANKQAATIRQQAEGLARAEAEVIALQQTVLNMALALHGTDAPAQTPNALSPRRNR